MNCFIDPTDEKERFLRVAINCKFSDAVGKSLESLPEAGLPVIEASLPENDRGIYKGTRQVLCM